MLLGQRLNIENDWDELISPMIWIGILIFWIITMAKGERQLSWPVKADP